MIDTHERIWNVFQDYEKEPFGRGDTTLFVYRAADDALGMWDAENGRWVGPAQDRLFTLAEVGAVAVRSGSDRIYLGSHETDPTEGEVEWALRLGLAVTVETADYALAHALHAMGEGKRLTVVWRCDAPFVVKVRQGERLTFLAAQGMWTEDTEATGATLAKLYLGGE